MQGRPRPRREADTAPMDTDAFTRRYPVLFHVTEQSAWSSIFARGLLSASALLDLYGIHGADRIPMEAQPRSRSVVLAGPGLPDVTLRDQKPLLPLRDQHLDGGMTVADWCRELNQRVYLFTAEEDAARLLRAYPGQRMFTIRSADMLARNAARVRVSGINTGYAMRRPARRGPSTSVPLQDLPIGRIKEFTVLHSIPDFADLVI